MSDDLIKRLRDHENEGVTASDRFALREEAADAIEAERKKRDELAEVERLRTALIKYGKHAENCLGDLSVGTHKARICVCGLRAAIGNAAPPVIEKRGEPAIVMTIERGKAPSFDFKHSVWGYGDFDLYTAPPVDPEKRERVMSVAAWLEGESHLTICPPGDTFNERMREAAALLREAYL
jgi:hypothetical protein